MAKMTATDAKNRFGQMLELAQKEPVRIQKNGRDVGVVISPEEFAALEAIRSQSTVRPRVREMLQKSVKDRASVYRALAK